MVSRPSHFRSSPCDPNRLRRLLGGAAAEECPAEIAEHLETCAACRRQLELLAAEPSWWRKAQELLSSHEIPVCRSNADSAELAETGDVASRVGRHEKHSPITLDFLAPSDDPQKLGRLGAYEVTEVIGRGGAGVVLKAFDPALNRFVAVKALAAHLASNAAARRRFAREAQAAAAVVHEHVVAIHSVQETAGQPYLVMQYVAGRSLQERLDQDGPLELKEIVRIAMQAAAGLAAAHAQGLVHRDIKPANILLENGVERVKLTDFGLARTIDDASLTQSGVVAGTPQYMAPEQVRGEAMDHRSDLFSLGSVIYAMCTGHSPFRAETMMGVLRRICADSPRPVREVNPDISEWLAEAIDRLLGKDPSERFQTAEELAEQLGQYLAHLQQPTLTPRPASPGRHRLSRKRLARGALAAVGAAVLLAAAVWGGGNVGFWPGQLQRQAVEQTRSIGSAPAAEASTTSGQTERFGLAEWNRFEQELNAARQQTDDLERRWKRSSDGATPLADPLPALEAELDAMEQKWTASR